MLIFAVEMTRVQKFWWMTVLLMALLLTAHSGWQRSGYAHHPKPEQQAATTVTTPQDSHHHEATLTDATNLYRVCSSRPQRLLPTQGSKTERTTSTMGGFVRRHHVKPLQFLHDSRRRLETAPFPLSASCRYYVIALRHNIR